MSRNAPEQKLVAKNRRAHFDFELTDRYEAGLVLLGSEVRALREHGADLTSAWVQIDARGEAWIRDMRVPTLQHAAFAHQEKRTRKLLLGRAEIEKLRGTVEREGLTLVATSCYFKNNRAKVEIALARGKKQHDKRHALRAKDQEKEARQAMRRGRG
jgi:SsrA-binding protein